MGRIIEDGITGMLKGVNYLVDRVKKTMGPLGKTVAIGSDFGVHLTKDGVTVANFIHSKDPIENMGIQIVREVANKTVGVTGDGTTQSMVLTQSIINEGVKNLKEGYSSTEIKRGLEFARDTVFERLDSMAYKIKADVEDVKNVSFTSANNDNETADLVTKAYSLVEYNGLVEVETSTNLETTISLDEGMVLNRGYLNPFFVTNQQKMTCELDKVKVLSYAGEISTLNQLIPSLNYIMETNSSLLIIADDVTGKALETLITNKMQNGMKVCVIKSPGIGKDRVDLLDDIQSVIGGKVLSVLKGDNLETINPAEDLGSVDRILVSGMETSLVGISKVSEDRLKYLEGSIKDAPTEYEKNKYIERLAKLTSGIALINVGGFSEIEIKEKKDRIDDAVGAVRCALKEGVLPGGGVALLKCIKTLDKKDISKESKDFQNGFNILKSTLMAPICQILLNGDADLETIIKKLKNGSDDFIGYNMKESKYQNFKESGILDPLLVTKTALANAISTGSMFFSISCAISKDVHDV